VSRKQVIILVAVGLFVALGVVFGFIYRPAREVFTSGVAKNGNTPVSMDNLGLPTGEVFTSEVPKDAKLTAPAGQSAAAPGVEEKLGIFNMTVSANGFEPNSITVKLGDVVHINLTARGGDYDFAMPWSGLYASVKNGEAKPITFGATSAGTFLFSCRDMCPAGKTIRGSIVVLP